jgi:MalT-like TPR region
VDTLSQAYGGLLPLRGDADQTAAFARWGLAALGEGERTLEEATRWYLSVADWLAGRLAAAERAFAASVDGWLAAGEQTLAAWGYHYLGQVEVGQGRLGAALGTYRRALAGAEESGASTLQVTRLVHIGMAGVL